MHVVGEEKELLQAAFYFGFVITNEMACPSQFNGLPVKIIIIYTF